MYKDSSKDINEERKDDKEDMYKDSSKDINEEQKDD